MANYKRKQFKSSTMKKCGLCGSQRRSGKRYGREPLIERAVKKEIQGIA